MRTYLRALRLGNRYAWLWTLTVAATVVAAGALVLAPFLFRQLNQSQQDTQQAVAQTRALTCALGDLVQLSGGSRQSAIVGPTYHLRAELNFLQTILGANCRQIQGRSKARNEVVKTIRLIQRELNRRAEEGP